MRILRGLVVAIALAGCADVYQVPSTVADSRYVVLGPEGVAMARVITGDSRCPDLVVDDSARPMTLRMPAQTIPQRPTTNDPSRSKPSEFPVLTCEAVVPAGAREASIGGARLPLPRANPQRIVVLGDTGCRINVGDNAFQNCDDPAQWPFERIAHEAAATAPDLVIHVGDYHYRENACPAGDPGCFGSPWGYGWDAWRADFFHPARKLFAVAPWVVLRGNHETCTRAGQGWWRFLDPRPVSLQQNCNAAVDDVFGDYSDSYVVPLDTARSIEIIVFDSSRVGVTPIPPGDLMYRNYRTQFTDAFARTAASPQAWFLAHHPVLAFAANPTHPTLPFPGNAGLQSVLQDLYPTVLFPPNVEALFSGHNHIFQMLSFSSPHPPQFVSGNAGVYVDPAFPTPFPAGREPSPGAVVAELVATNRFGYLVLDRAGAGWKMTAWDVHGKVLTTCTLQNRQARCEPIANPWIGP